MKTTHAVVSGVPTFKVAWKQRPSDLPSPVTVTLKVPASGLDIVDGVVCDGGGLDPIFISSAVTLAVSVSDDTEVQCTVIDALIGAYMEGQRAAAFDREQDRTQSDR